MRVLFQKGLLSKKRRHDLFKLKCNNLFHIFCRFSVPIWGLSVGEQGISVRCDAVVSACDIDDFASTHAVECKQGICINYRGLNR